MYLKAWGPIQGSNIKNVWLTCKRIRLTSGLFSLLLLFFHDFFNFLFSLPFHALGKGWKCILSNNHLVKIHKVSHDNFKLIKNEGVCVLSTMPSIHICIFYSHRNWATRIKKNNEKEKTKKWATSDLSLHFDSPNHVLSFKLFFFFWFRPIGFPSKMMLCKVNQNLICLDPEPLSKGLDTNVKLLTNRNARFHWTLLLGPLSKVALSLHVLS